MRSLTQSVSRGFLLGLVACLMVAGSMLAVPDVAQATGGRQSFVQRQRFRSAPVQQFRAPRVQRFRAVDRQPVIVTASLHAPRVQFQQFQQFQSFGAHQFRAPAPIVVPGGYVEFFIR